MYSRRKNISNKFDIFYALLNAANIIKGFEKHEKNPLKNMHSAYLH